MNDTLNYIEAYFQNELSEAESKAFEIRCTTDQQFAEDVAFYINARQAAKERLLTEKREQWKSLKNYSLVSTEEQATRVKNLFLRKIMPFAIAACLLIAVALVYLNNANDSRLMADKYVKEHYQQLSITMNGEKDSLNTAIEAYNNQDYRKSLQYFQSLHTAYPKESDYIKYSGIVYLMTKDYDKALQQFSELAAIENIRSNPGLFLSALTLIIRDQQGDKAKAKELLQRVINEKLDGMEDAEKLLNTF